MEKHYKASLSPGIKVFSWILVLLIVAGIIYSANTIVIPLLLVLVFCGAYMFAPKGYLLTEKMLRIEKVVGNIDIKISRISEVVYIKGSSNLWKELGFTLRLFGAGGFFGGYGLFWSPKKGKFWLYSTKSDTLVLVTLDNGIKYGISPDEADDFIRELRKRLKREKVKISLVG